MNIELMSLELLTASFIVFFLLVDLFMKDAKRTLGILFPLVMLALLAFAIWHRKDGVLLNGAYVADGLSWFAKIIILSGAFLTGLLSVNYVKMRPQHAGAYYALLTSSILGMLFLVSSRELITLYVSLETSTFCLIGLTAFYKRDEYSLEAGLKYLVIGAISSGILLYGISMVYASTATTYLDGILAFTSVHSPTPFLVIGVIMMILGIGFKLSIVPMHVWTPDVYQGSPTPITAFISVVSKAAGFVFAVRILMGTFANLAPIWAPVIAILSFLTMTIGNLIAIPQKNIKRLMAFSAISQAGYILFGFLSTPELGVSSIIFYLLVYTFTNIAAFATISAFEHATGFENIEDYAGLAREEPILALALLFSLLSLAGVPPFAGFFGKYYLFYALMKKGYMWLVIAGAVNSTIALYYYLLILKQVYIFDRKKEYPKIVLPISVKIALIITIAVIVLLGIFPTPVVNITAEIARQLFPVPGMLPN